MPGCSSRHSSLSYPRTGRSCRASLALSSRTCRRRRGGTPVAVLPLLTVVGWQSAAAVLLPAVESWRQLLRWGRCSRRLCTARYCRCCSRRSPARSPRGRCQRGRQPCPNTGVCRCCRSRLQDQQQTLSHNASTLCKHVAECPTTCCLLRVASMPQARPQAAPLPPTCIACNVTNNVGGALGDLALRGAVAAAADELGAVRAVDCAVRTIHTVVGWLAETEASHGVAAHCKEARQQ
jgi:hypothetical protein